MIPADLNFDNEMDLVVTWSDSRNTYLQLVYKESDYSFDSKTPKWIVPSGFQPSLLDLNGDLRLDLVSNFESVPNAQSIILKSNYKNSDRPLKSFSSTSENCLQVEDFNLTNPHSVAFVDLNNDCVADLFLTVDKNGVKSFQVWLNQRNGKYCFVWEDYPLEGTGQVSFADIDRNGLEDMVFPVCTGKHCSKTKEIHIVYNFNNQDHSSESAFECEFSQGSISKDKFSLKDLGSPTQTQHKGIFKITEDKVSFFNEEPDYPFTARFGDLDLDGCPDMLLNLYEPSKGSDSAYIKAFRNQLCESSEQVFGEWEDLKEIETIKGAFLGVFFDLDENGILDILISSKHNGVYNTTSFYNNLLNDHFHLKALALDGHSKQGYSSVYPGAVFKFTLIELDMTKVPVHATQLPQTAYNSLLTPFCVFGLGRTNSFIEEFHTALPVSGSGKVYKYQWTPIIPNSYLIVSPDPENNWFLELFASPTEDIWVIVAMLLGCMVVIGVVILVKYFNEKANRPHKGIGPVI